MAERGVRTVRSRSWVLLALIAVTGAGCTPMDNLVVSIFGRSMRWQSSVGPHEDPRLPAPGTVPFAAGNFPAAPFEYGMNQAEGTAVPEPVTALMVLQATGNPSGFPQVTALTNPVPADAASLERGGEVFLRACAPCHGGGGAGDGSVTARGIPQWSLLSDAAMGYSDGYLYSIIRAGRGAMPAYGYQISHFDRWHVVNYLRQLQGMTPAAAPVAAPANASTEAEGDASDA
jgi:mono/diheme cytochrome c family protein